MVENVSIFFKFWTIIGFCCFAFRKIHESKTKTEAIVRAFAFGPAVWVISIYYVVKFNVIYIIYRYKETQYDRKM